MPPTWPERHSALLDAFGIENDGDCDDKLAVALDEQYTANESEIARLRFGNKDLKIIGALESGQFASVELVKCRLNNTQYVRKTTDKAMVRRCSQQCFPQTERDILLLATRDNATFIPHLIASYHSSSFLYLIMEYASGGTLWEVLESSPPDTPGISEHDLKWWIPQAVAAIGWCHDQGFCHRDIKPHNFAIKSAGHLVLLDFASAAPFLPPKATDDYSRLIPGKYCLAPCGTCDYIAPEILKHFEDQVIVFEAADSSVDPEEEDSNYQDSVSHLLTKSKKKREIEGCYGVEVDWWSLGVTIYELFYGAAPFFAQEIKQTYDRIRNHKRHLHFPESPAMSADLKELIRGLLQDSKTRLGRKHVSEVKQLDWFEDVSWDTLHRLPPPSDLHLPQFEYTDDAEEGLRRSLTHSRASSIDQGFGNSDAGSRPFAFSQFFKSSVGSKIGETPARLSLPRSVEIEKELATFVGYTWGPAANTFEVREEVHAPNHTRLMATPRVSDRVLPGQTPGHGFTTPMRMNRSFGQTLQRTGTVQRTINGRPLTNREAMDALLDVIGMTAQKKVLDSGRKPRSMKRLGGFAKRNGPTVPLSLRFQLGKLEIPPGPQYRELDPLREMGDDDDDDSIVSTLPSPSPTPRPGSAMSTTLTFTRRSMTPTATLSSLRNGLPTSSSTTTTNSLSPPDFTRSINGRARASSESTISRTTARARVAKRSSSTVSLNQRGLDIMEARLAKLERDIDEIAFGLQQVKSVFPRS